MSDKKAKKLRLEKALDASKKMVKVADGTDKAYKIVRKYILPAACIAFAVFAYAAYDVNISEEMKKK